VDASGTSVVSSADPVTTVYVADDSPDVRKRVAEAVKELATVTVAEFESVAALTEGVTRRQPDIVILDDRLRPGSGLDVLRVLNADYPLVRVIVFSDTAEPYRRDMFLRAGAYAFFSKAEGCEAMLDAIRSLAAAGRCG
jgi:DNA-binding NarL/FixJ family response regulator